MHPTLAYRFLLAVAVALSGVASTDGAPLTFNLRFTRQATGLFDAFISGGLVFSFGGSLIAPDGTIFSNPTESRNLTFEQLSNRYVGVWTVNDRYLFPIGGLQQHQITIAAISESELITETPFITSITNGQIVPKSFNVHWEWPGGATPSLLGSPGVSISYTTGLTANYLGNSTYQMTTNFAPGELQREVTVRAGSSQNLGSKITSIISLSANPQNTIMPSLTYQSYSAQVTVTSIVPEPATGVLMTMIAAVVSVVVRSYPGSHVVRVPLS